MARFDGTGGDDVYDGTPDADVIFGLAGDDILSGAGGDDRIDAGTGRDAVDGGDGLDTLTVDYARRTGSRTHDIASGTEGFEGTFRSIEAQVAFRRIETLAVMLGMRDDTVTLDGAALLLGGTVTIDAGGGEDLLIADLSAISTDLARTSTGIAGVGGSYAGFEAYWITLGAGSNRVEGWIGDDRFHGGGGIDLIDGGAGEDSYTATLTGGAATVSIDETGMALSNGSRVTAVESIVLQLGAAADLVRIADGESAAIHGGDGEDRFEVHDGRAIDLFGDGGDDSFFSDSRGNRVRVDGGAGHDRLTVDYRAFGATDRLESRVEASDQGLFGGINRSGGQGTSLTGIEALTAYLTSGDDRFDVHRSVTSGAFELAVDAGTGTDTLSLDLRLLPGATIRVRDGGITLPDQTFTGFERFEIVTGEGDNDVRGGDGDDIMTGGPGYFSYSTELVGRDRFFGRGGDDLLQGGSGRDLLVGGDGDDRLSGGRARDRLIGGPGDDAYRVVLEEDQLVEQANGGIDTIVTSTRSYTLAEHFENLAVHDVGYFYDNGNFQFDEQTDFAGTFRGTGNTADNRITGALFARNVLAGLDGADVLRGGAEDDRLNGGAGSDTVSYYSPVALSRVTVDLRIAGAQDTGGGGIDRLVSIENVIGSRSEDRLIGDDGDNILFGASAADVLIGGGGDDRLRGGHLDDTLTGGAGADSFVYVDEPDEFRGIDLITDFSRAEGDRIDLGEVLADADLSFIGAGAFSGAGAEVRAFAAGEGRYTVQVDTDADAVAELVISVVSAAPLDAVDFVL
jgi:Ca2+-binding RTX toxin-like protein